MPSGNHDLNIAKNVKIIEWLKAEIVTSIGSLYQAMVVNSEEMIQEALATLMVSGYFLAKRVGISYEKLDERIAQKLESPTMKEHEIEKWYGDVTSLQQYVNKRNR
ncbi:MAG TPA: MazG-like family protein [Bacillota bacterium]|nr:MazG-like family protein [Bacillota bacterium]HOL11201.1 MazG-like family protein [Bacillota bacterium]HPO98910.1 MazG-like family protein [Bacillota bacterium]